MYPIICWDAAGKAVENGFWTCGCANVWAKGAGRLAKVPFSNEGLFFNCRDGDAGVPASVEAVDGSVLTRLAGGITESEFRRRSEDKSTGLICGDDKSVAC